MTSASELFYTRRHRLGRSTNDIGFDSSSARDLIFNNRRHHLHHRRHDLDDGEALRRATHMRQPCRRGSQSHAEHAIGRLDIGSSWSLSRNSINVAENVSGVSSPRATGTERLPTAVMLARARLVERLGGAPISRNRQSGRSSLGIDESRGFHSMDQDSELWTSQMRRSQSQFSQEPNIKPPGLSQEALDCLHMEVFSSRETGLEGLQSGIVHDCGICLEVFVDGDELICLPCGHRFHSGCLVPWVRRCGDCPFCRSSIVVKYSCSQCN
ncbi:hypothetical protein L6164_032083 [Bauhinia variegata]|uniref:Uncharacterized protein n=1 Tax=Bauhinia variegata TaxID=167791 RepID=A0ACB9KMR4_BAUVA|nr:hypothetical protein L6164_032083 [Bauhinia variegata]